MATTVSHGKTSAAALTCLLITFAWALMGPASAASPVAFPGAVGFGATATGGRTGTVYHVTNLNDSGTGSFRDAVSQSNRIIVFDVGGYVQLLSDVSTASNLTIAGQTAPGGGFGVFGSEVSFSAQSNCIVRHIRFRDGSLDPNWAGQNSGNSHTNCVGLYNTSKMIFDHCSLEFAAYNNVDAVEALNITFSNCIIADPIRNQQFNFHFENGPGTFINNLWVNAHNRNPLGKANLQYVNNVVYNYQAGFTTGDSTGSFSYDIINNYFIAGPSTSSPSNAYFQVDSSQSAYATGNYIDSSANGTLHGTLSNAVGSATVLSSPVYTSTASLPTVSAANAVINDMANSGAFPRDQVDTQVLGNVASLGTAGQLLNTQANTGLSNSGYGTISGGAAPIDSDGDGMPDFWETANGLNPNSASDGNALASDGSGYTNLEEYINWLAAPHAVCLKNSSVGIDLSQYAVGLSNRSYAVSSPTGGTVTVSGSTATFTPTTGTVGLGGFTFTVTGTTGTISNSLSVCTSATTTPIAVTWKGDGTANSWDNTNAANDVWASSTGLVAWSQGDTATLDDTGSLSPAINLANAILPASLSISTVNNYTLSGVGSLGGTMSMNMNGYGTGSLTFANTGTNSFTGAVSITDATVSLNNSYSLGVGALTLSNVTLVFTTGSLSITNSPITVNSASNINMPHNGGSDFINGTVSGASPLNISLNGTTGTLGGNVTGFTSTFNVTGPGTFRMDNSPNWGVPNGILSITGGATIDNRYASASAITIPLGSLSGTAGTTLYGSDQSLSAGGTCTYSIGSLNQSTTFAGAITNSPNQTVAITKVGSGTLTLSGANTYTGATTVSAGTLLLTGSLGNTPVTISAGSLIGTGTIGTTSGGAVTMQSGTILSPGGNTGSFGTLTVGHGLSLATTTIQLDLSSNPSGSNDEIVMQGGTLALSGTSPLQLNLVNGALGAGTYTLIGGGTATTGSASNLSSSLPTVTRQTLALSASSGQVLLKVTGNAASLIWTGANNGGTWDPDTTSNWSNSGKGDYFFNLDSVTFNDTSSVGAVTISGTVQPGSITVTDNSTNYTLGGTGVIGGLATLTKNGTGTLTIDNTGANTFTGGTTINAGTVAITLGTSLGTGTITLNGGTLKLAASNLALANAINVTAASTLAIGGGSSYWSGALTGSSPLIITIPSSAVFTPTGDWSAFNSTITLTGGSLRFNQGSNTWGGSSIAFILGSGNTLYNRSLSDVTINLGSLTGPAGSALSGSDQVGPAVDTYVIGALNTSTVFAGNITDGGNTTTPQTVAISKVGTGTFTFSGSGTYSGSTTIQAGTLAVSGTIDSGSGTTIEATSGATLNLSGGTLTADTILVDSGGILTGAGTINGGLTNSGTVTISAAGTLTVNGDIVNTGTMRLANGALLSNSGSFLNSGLLDLIDAGSTQSVPSNIVNTGTVLTASANVKISQVSLSGSTLTATIQSYTGHTYQLQRAGSLASPTVWTNVGNSQAGTGSVLTLSDSTGGTQGYYHVLVTSP